MHNALFGDSFEACEYFKPMFLNGKYFFGKSDRLLDEMQVRWDAACSGNSCQRQSGQKLCWLLYKSELREVMLSSLISGCSRWPKPTNWRANPDEETTDWRARRGRTAHRVRRGGTVIAVPYPYKFTFFFRFIENWLMENRWRLDDSKHFREVLLGSFIGLSVKLLAAGSVFLMNVLVARKLGAAEAGLFFLGFTLVSWFSAVGRFGLDNSLIRFVASALDSGDLGCVNSVYRKSMLWAGAVCSVLTISLLVLGEPLATVVFDQPGFGPVLLVMTFGVPLVSLYTLHAEALKGFRLVAKSMMTVNLIVPLVMLIGLVFFPVDTSLQTAYIYVGACFLALLVGWFWWHVAARNTAPAAPFPSEVLLASCLPLWGVMFLSQCTLWSSQLMLGAWSTTQDVALFAAAQRTAMLTSFVLVAINAIAAPKFASMHSRGDIDGLRKVALWSVRLMIASAVPVLLFMIICREWLMLLFGNEFVDASGALLILAIGQFVNVVTGSVGFLLSMTGHERCLRSNGLIGALLGVSLGVILIPVYGLTGGAVATAGAVACQNLLGVYYVKRLLGFNTLAFWQKI